MCHRCNCMVDATIMQRRIRWIAKLSCPHSIKQMGYTQPIDVLEERGMLYHGDKDRSDNARKKMRQDWETQKKEKDMTEKLF